MNQPPAWPQQPYPPQPQWGAGMPRAGRPGGLTAMAIINFIFGGLGMLVFGGSYMMVSASPEMLDQAMQAYPPQQAAQMQDMLDTIRSIPYIVHIMGVSVLCCFLLIVAGIGYLKQNKILGYGAGNVYGVLGLGVVIAQIALDPSGMAAGNVIYAVYPALTLILLNTTFRNDFNGPAAAGGEWGQQPMDPNAWAQQQAWQQQQMWQQQQQQQQGWQPPQQPEVPSSPPPDPNGPSGPNDPNANHPGGQA